MRCALQLAEAALGLRERDGGLTIPGPAAASALNSGMGPTRRDGRPGEQIGAGVDFGLHFPDGEKRQGVGAAGAT